MLVWLMFVFLSILFKVFLNKKADSINFRKHIPSEITFCGINKTIKPN